MMRNVMDRFKVLNDKEVLDNETNLVWQKDANAEGCMSWQDAMDSIPEGWRLPTVKELITLLDYNNFNPALPSDHPFTNVQSYYYWSSTTYAYNTVNAWIVNMWNGYVYYDYKGYDYYYVWPVRDKKIGD